MTVWWQDRA